ncbi:MAG: nucleoside triphosphate pyrophosphohydrolase [Desertifilum sp. SIO1I2]|nr:nucleoside triphosphate pyrophosphohydrolase [Desertifilum sp. SIO1I2]
MSTAESDSTLAALQELIEVVAKLRSPQGGCPWDLAQTPQTLTPYVLEEAYEVVDAIKNGDRAHICEELGDLLLQIVLQAQIASEAGDFTLTEVAQGISEKLIRRHPHVFSDVEANTIAEVHQNWEQIKAAEKGETDASLSQKLQRYARTLPPMTAAMKISTKAASAGFEWDNVEGVWDKFDEELAEFKHALQAETPIEQASELGDLLFTLVNIARWYDLDPADALQETNYRFLRRLQVLETFADKPLADYTLGELEQLWQKAKASLAQRQP